MIKIMFLIIILISSPIIVLSGLILLGTLIGERLNPSSHNHYLCVCEEPPIMTEVQAIIFGIISFAFITCCMNLIVRGLRLNKHKHFGLITILSMINGLIIAVVVDILSTQISG